MRWFFFALLGANLFFIFWFGLNSVVGDAVVKPLSDESAPTIQLLSEVDLPSLSELSSQPRKCDYYGPFFTSDESKGFLALIEGRGGEGQNLEEWVRSPPYYKLYVAPLSNGVELEGVLNRLRAGRFDAELVREGGRRNSIWLGDYETLQHIEQLKSRLTKYNVNVEVLERSRDYRQFWVVLGPGSGSVVEGDLKALLLEKYPEIIHKEKVCKSVALVK